MLGGIISIPKVINAKNSKTTIDTCIMLKQTLLIIKDISESIQHIKERISENALVTVIVDNINQSTMLHEITDAIENYITESTQYSKSSQVMRHQECFAIKTGISGMLDIARKTYLQSVEDIYEVSIYISVTCVSLYLTVWLYIYIQHMYPTYIASKSIYRIYQQ